MSTRMQFDAFGEPSVLYPFEFEAAAPGPGELLVSNRALGVNPYDWKYVSGGMSSEPPARPIVPGNEGAGVIIAVGADVTGFAVGDEVIWNVHLGGYATDRVVPVAKAWLKPASVGFEEAASLPVAAGTAFAAIRQLAIGPGAIAGGPLAARQTQGDRVLERLGLNRRRRALHAIVIVKRHAGIGGRTVEDLDA